MSSFLCRRFLWHDKRDSSTQAKELRRAKLPNKKKMLLYFEASVLASPLRLPIIEPVRDTCELEQTKEVANKRKGKKEFGVSDKKGHLLFLNKRQDAHNEKEKYLQVVSI